jgi:hypothetical protein
MAQLFATRGTQQFKPYNAPDDAPVYDYKLAGHNINTKAIKDTGGQEWYLTDGGQWRNTATKQAQAAMPNYGPQTVTTMGAPTPAAAPAAPAPGPTNNTNPQTMFKSIYEFLPKANENLFSPVPQKSLMEYLPKNWEGSPAYTQALNRGNQNLEKQLNARGLLGSGAEIEAKNDLSAQLLAQDTDRMMQVAQVDSQNQVNETNNVRNLLSELLGNDFNAYNNQMADASQREMTRDSQGINVMSLILDYLKSQNPMQYGFPATNTIADNNLKLGSQLASLAGSSGGGGGGGGSRPAVAPTYAPPPQFQSSTNDLMSIGASILPSLISAFNKK